MLAFALLQTQAWSDSRSVDSVDAAPGFTIAQIAEWREQVEHCLRFANKSLPASVRPVQWRLKLRLSNPEAVVPGGSAGLDEIHFSGLPEQTTACHEVFHVVWARLSTSRASGGFQLMKPRPFTSDGKTTELFESAPQLFAVLASEECLLGGPRTPAPFQYDHCAPVRRAELPSAYERYLSMRDFVAGNGDPTGSLAHFERVLASASKNRPSAYDASRPAGSALKTAATRCGKEFLAAQLVEALIAESHAAGPGRPSFDDTDQLARALYGRIERADISRGNACARALREALARAGIE